MEKQPKEKYPNGYVIQNDSTVRQGTPWKIVLMTDLADDPCDAEIADAVACWVYEHHYDLLVFDPLAIRAEEIEIVNVNGSHSRFRRIEIEGMNTWQQIASGEFRARLDDLTAAVFRVGDFYPFARLAYGTTIWQVQFSKDRVV